MKCEYNDPSMRLWVTVLFALWGAAEVCYFLLHGSTVVGTLYLFRANGHELVMQWVFPFAGAALFLLLAGAVPLQRRVVFALLAAGCLLFYALINADIVNHASYIAVFVIPIPLAIILLAKVIHSGCNLYFTNKPFPQWINGFFWIAFATAALGCMTNAVLRVNSIIFPLTYDLYLLKIDAAYGGLAQWVTESTGNASEWFRELILQTYNILAAMFFPVIALLAREAKTKAFNVWRMLVVPFIAAWLCYAWLPATGPAHVLGPAYPGNVPDLSSLEGAMVSVVPVPRNAMPSMHFSGALWTFMLLLGLRSGIWAWLGALFVFGTAWATLGLGEHYVIDLVVAMPFASFLGVWLIDPPGWRSSPAAVRRLHGLTGWTFLVWMLLLRLCPNWLATQLLFVQVFSIWSVVVSLLVLHRYGLCARGAAVLKEFAADRRQSAISVLPSELQGRRWLVGIFFVSGFAGLVYEVVYAKALGVTYGGTALAANTVLVTYMGGMALGAWLGGSFAERTHRPMFWYALAEATIGIYAAITPQLFQIVQTIYVVVASDAAPDADWLTGLRVGLGVAVLGVPTVLMGATMPLVFQRMRLLGIPTSRAIAPLYGANVLGAAAGALAAGYFLLPAVGKHGGTLIAAVISLMVALYVLDKLRKELPDGIVANGEADRGISSSRHVVADAYAGWAAVAILMVGGAVTLALEVVNMHLLAVVAGNSVYAFGLMLATFLLGLGLGSSAGEHLLRKYTRVSLVLAAQCGLALSILLTAFVWDGLADYMGSFAYVFGHGVTLDFPAREFIRALVCALAMFPPAVFIGMSYPAAMGLAADWLGRQGDVTRAIGKASGINTLGNISGVLLAGFWWLPVWGSRNVLWGLAIVASLLALLAWFATLTKKSTITVGRSGLLVGATLIAVAFLFPERWNYTALSQGGNVYFFSQPWGDVIDVAESVEGGVTTVARNPNGLLTLLTNGKFQGNNSETGEMVAQESFALMPLLHTENRESGLVIGYGTGMTARTLHSEGFKSLDIVEISKDVATLADRHFSNINGGVSSKTGVNMHYTDGRNFLLTQNRSFDLISMEISSIWFSGAANLYNREFYELSSRRLNPDGVLQQWVQLHHMQPLDFLYILGSVRSVFRYVWIYEGGGQGIIVASNSLSAVNNAGAIDKLKNIPTISGLKVDSLSSNLLAAPARIDELLGRYDPELRVLVSTDNNLRLEYSTPKGNALRADTVSIIKAMLKGE